MARIIDFDELKDIGERKILNESTTFDGIISKASRDDNYKNVFLSYSSKDKELLPGVIKILENHNGKVYIDKGDNRLPVTTSVETAKILKDTIQKLPRMVVFVTTKSKDSKWIPWELGLGDGSKKNYDIAIFPSAENRYDESWTKQEYLGLYRRIVFGKYADYDKEIWMVCNCKENTATPLKDWLNVNSSQRGMW